MNANAGQPSRIAFVVSHPIQYYAPLYQLLAQRRDTAVKVFFTWHAGEQPVRDEGFKIELAWDVPLTSGYDFQAVANVSRDPGTHHFLGLRNPTLVNEVLSWRPDVVHVTGWKSWSHLTAMRAFRTRGVPVLFRGDSHLLDEDQRSPKWRLKRAVLRQVYSWPRGFLVVGAANRRYYEAFGVPATRLHSCPHSIDVARFAGRDGHFDRQAAEWRARLQIEPGQFVVLYAGKFETKKRPVEFMRAIAARAARDVVAVMVGDGELEPAVRALAAGAPGRFRVLPFQNQSMMPVVYRLGDVFVLPSQFGETWGLAVNEAMACGRPVVVSDRVGCAEDVVTADCGRVFPWRDLERAIDVINEMAAGRDRLPSLQEAARRRASMFDVGRTAEALLDAIAKVETGA